MTRVTWSEVNAEIKLQFALHHLELKVIIYWKLNGTCTKPWINWTGKDWINIQGKPYKESSLNANS